MKNKKGFTLIELLAVIVILGVLMAIAIPSMTGYISNSKKDTLLNSAQQLLSGAKDMLTSENAYPGPNTAVIIPVSKIDLEKGGVSPYDNNPFDESQGKSYIIVYNKAKSDSEVSSTSYEYYIALTDQSNNCLETISETLLTTAKTKAKRTTVKGGSCNITAAKSSSGAKTFNVLKDKTDTLSSISPASVIVYGEGE